MHMVNHVTGKEGAEAFMPNMNKALSSDEAGLSTAKSKNNLTPTCTQILGPKTTSYGSFAFFLISTSWGKNSRLRQGDIVVKSMVCCKDGQAVVAPPPPEPTPVKKKAPTDC